MNKGYLPNETGEQRRVRLRQEMNQEAVGHMRAVIKALKAAGHQVVAPDDLSTDYCGDTWKVDGTSITVVARLEHKGSSFYSTPTGGLRITVGPYGLKKTFVKKTSAKELVKHPAGFDYETIAQTMLDILKQEQEAREERRQAEKTAAENDAVAVPAARRLTKEFGLRSFHDIFVGHPLRVERGHKELGLEFRGLTEEQARAILCAARDCGALKE
jgi:Asp-tRNA(Asn)/Glu-tRNA(Gln) amidotransferase A subunit family amidase